TTPTIAKTVAIAGLARSVHGPAGSRQPFAAEVEMSTTAKLIAATTIATIAIVPSALRERTRVSPAGSDPSSRMLEVAARRTASPVRGFRGALAPIGMTMTRQRPPGGAGKLPEVRRRVLITGSGPLDSGRARHRAGPVLRLHQRLS